MDQSAFFAPIPYGFGLGFCVDQASYLFGQVIVQTTCLVGQEKKRVKVKHSQSFSVVSFRFCLLIVLWNVCLLPAVHMHFSGFVPEFSDMVS